MKEVRCNNIESSYTEEGTRLGSLHMKGKLTFSSPVATAEFSKCAGILSASHLKQGTMNINILSYFLENWFSFRIKNRASLWLS